MKITMIGTGYVGLVSGACLAENGHHVVCVDIDERKIAMLKRGEIPIYEPGLDEMVERNVKARRLEFSQDIREGCSTAEVVFFCVGTPPGTDGAADLSFLFKAAEDVAEALSGPAVLVTKSTVPVGTARKLWNVLQQKAKHPFEIVSNPEFLKEGDAINDFMKPDRVVVGCQSDHARKVMEHIYEPFVRTGSPILFMDLESSEMTKYAANAFLATKISFMNELSRLAMVTGADIETVRKGIGFDRRIGHLFMFPGVGYGGSCFPKDVKALVALGEQKGTRMEILRSVEEVNERQKLLLVDRLVQRFSGKLEGKVIALWGLAFKPKTDDIREAPAVIMTEKLLSLGATVRITDPVAIPNGKELFGDKVEFSDDAFAILEGADALLVVTEWNEFRRPDFLRMKALMRTPVLLDGRNVYDPEAMRALGFEYSGIGRKVG
jgi:UDPglucose 6-dehydrogenase